MVASPNAGQEHPAKGQKAIWCAICWLFAAERMMDMEIEAKTGVTAGSRRAATLNHRNGYRERGWTPALAGSIWRAPS